MEVIIKIQIDLNKTDEDKFLSFKQNLSIVKTRIGSYLSGNCDFNFKLNFMDNYVFYSQDIGFENTIDILLPCLDHIVFFC